jgi:hypothetical protein
MGTKGLELVNVYPNTLPDDTMNEIVIKSMPMSAKDGDFASSTAQGCLFESYIFTVPGEQRNNIASLIAIFDKSNYNRDTIRKIFAYTVDEINRHNLGSTEIFSKILPNLYEGLTKGKLKIKISSVVTLDFEIEDESKKKDRGEEFLESMKGELWR